MSQLTPEQQQVVASQASLLVVDAFAGTGKTSTLVEYARARPRSRGLYLAFNKSVATEASDRFPENVECRTTHSLAYRAVGRQYSDKLGNPQPYLIAQTLKCTPRRAKQVLDTVSSWLCSADPELTAAHAVPDDIASREEVEDLVRLARTAWDQMKSPGGSLKMPHDGYLKLWAMTNPKLQYDFIMLDEAQDSNPLTLDLILSQRPDGHGPTIVLVGDRHQGIYGFRKAMNAMESVEAEERIALTRSFRFGEGIADVASELLHAFKGEDRRIQGREDIEVSWSVDPEGQKTVISRTNAALFGVGAKIVRNPLRRSIYFVGGFESYVFGKVLDAYYLWADERSKIKDPSISRFPSFQSFKHYGAEVRDAEVNALVRTVEEYREEVPNLLNALREAATVHSEKADFTLTTAHKAKGLEWTQVLLTDDFITPPEAGEDFDPEEINLLYVAITRAVSAVDLPSSVVTWLEAVRGQTLLTKFHQPASFTAYVGREASFENRAKAAIVKLEEEYRRLFHNLNSLDHTSSSCAPEQVEEKSRLAGNVSMLAWVLEVLPRDFDWGQ